jgi:hypothetical protein
MNHQPQELVRAPYQLQLTRENHLLTGVSASAVVQLIERLHAEAHRKLSCIGADLTDRCIHEQW